MLDLEPLLKDAGCHVPVRPWHALRHTFGSHYVMSGSNFLALSKTLDHTKLETTMSYAHLAPNYLDDELARFRSRHRPPPLALSDFAASASPESVPARI